MRPHLGAAPASAAANGAVADLIVIGAGPKATAIAAKAHAINTLGLARISILVVEDIECGASWSGANGMTSGDERLVITPLKDLGFPYETHRALGSAGESIDRMLASLSWPAYLIAAHRYREWLDAGLPRVRHREYGRYLSWALAQADNGVELIRGRASRVSRACDGGEVWSVQIDTGEERIGRRGRALVLTGSGVHRRLRHDAAAARRILHYDSRRHDLDREIAAGGPGVAVIGGGDSALSSVLYLREIRPRAALTVYTPELPMSRGESFLENRVFADPDSVSWSELDLPTRRTFIRHADRGVFDAEDIARLANDEACSFVIGRVDEIVAFGDRLEIEYRAPDGVRRARHDYAVNCTGLDLLAQIEGLFSPDERLEIEAEAGPIWSIPPAPELAFGRALELRGLRPLLHIPALAALSQGPGFANLGCLGLLSNRILDRFVRNADSDVRDLAA
jgi:mycobactin lysine-N-oxygenase